MESVAAKGKMLTMTSPIVTEKPLVLQSICQDTFTHAAVREGDVRPVMAQPVRRIAG
jgi:hypothetical protein